MTRVIVIGSGIVGTMIAYELSLVPGIEIIVLDPTPPGQGVTRSALGVLSGVISQKLKGKRVKIRLFSLKRYETLIPELEAQIHRSIPYNRAGILKVSHLPEDLAAWPTLIAGRHLQGWPLTALDTAALKSTYPQVNSDLFHSGLFSPSDRQVHPLSLTQALVQAAQQNGVVFLRESAIAILWKTPLWNTPLWKTSLDKTVPYHGCTGVITEHSTLDADWVVVSAGLQSSTLLRSLPHPPPLPQSRPLLEIEPVLGQALHLRLPNAVTDTPEPVITSEDTLVVPLGNQEYWVGATLEFGEGMSPASPDPAALQQLLTRATAFYPALATAEILHTWSGLRPRPVARPAPVVEPLAGYPNILLATGHYRNGVLLAPVTAAMIKSQITDQPLKITAEFGR